MNLKKFCRDAGGSRPSGARTIRHIPFAALALAVTGIAAPIAAQVPVPALEAGSLLVTAGAARYRLSASADGLLASLDPVSRATFAALLRPDGDRTDDALWQQWAAGAMQVRHEQGDTSQTLWFNPVFDAGIVTRWRRIDGTWNAVAAAPVPGEALRGDHAKGTGFMPGFGPPPAIQAQAAATFRAAGNADWNMLMTPSAATRAIVVNRLRAGATELALMSSGPHYGEDAAFVRTMLVTADPPGSGLPAGGRAALARMGAATRQTLRPVAAWRATGGWSLVLQSPDAPGIAWFARFADPAPGGRAMPPVLTVVVYSHAGATR